MLFILIFLTISISSTSMVAGHGYEFSRSKAPLPALDQESKLRLRLAYLKADLLAKKYHLSADDTNQLNQFVEFFYAKGPDHYGRLQALYDRVVTPTKDQIFNLLRPKFSKDQIEIDEYGLKIFDYNSLPRAVVEDATKRVKQRTPLENAAEELMGLFVKEPEALPAIIAPEVKSTEERKKIDEIATRLANLANMPSPKTNQNLESYPASAPQSPASAPFLHHNLEDIEKILLQAGVPYKQLINSTFHDKFEFLEPARSFGRRIFDLGFLESTLLKGGFSYQELIKSDFTQKISKLSYLLTHDRVY